MQFHYFKDQLMHTVKVPISPLRVISLVPSQTELLFHLGLGNQILGVTKFCVHPKEAINNKEIIGGTKNFNFNKIDELKPDLIIGNKEENYLAGINKLKEQYPVWVSDIETLDDAIEMIAMIGKIFRVEQKAEELIASITECFKVIKPISKRAVYLIWNKPIMAVGKHTFINDMLDKAGIDNTVDNDRYPELTEEELQRLNPEVLLLSSEPFPFKEKHILYFQKIIPDAKIIIVDGELFSWYGSRLLKTPGYLNLLHSELNR